ncbi:PREDICTED: receptor-interacting serine/threonine-protein kinase 1-like [Branchiostoma belcheri]|uniref:Receptor-interacting serine/threonine-protein kinase 1-like n=1 Tax=Branchiostoma belcheri TaxID=7741 RepID=A0A6P4YG05_BRABE|nr:PREDICTED: receptor-interacting serine/threonine-protein kinase 1-like [Branchiostoma belcheri]
MEEVTADLTKELQIVADHIGNDWKRLLRYLSLKDNDLDVVDHDYKADGLIEKAYQGLRKWKQQEGNEATMQKLLAALKTIGRRDVIEKLPAGRPPDIAAGPSVPSHVPYDLTERTVPKQPMSEDIPHSKKRKRLPGFLKTLWKSV